MTFLQSALTLINKGKLNPHETQMLTTELETRVKRTSILLDNLLYWAQSQLKEVNPNPKELNFQFMVKEATAFYKPHMERKGVSLDVNYDATTKIVVDRECYSWYFAIW